MKENNIFKFEFHQSIEKALASVEEALLNVREAFGSEASTSVENGTAEDATTTTTAAAATTAAATAGGGSDSGSPSVGRAYIAR